jgi:hypothetical protein
MQFRHRAIGQERPWGVSPTIDPTINKTIDERIDIKPGVEESSEVNSEKKPIAPKIKISFSPERIHFPVRGAPGEFYAGSILLTVESKHGFIVKARAVPLHSKDGAIIPPERLFVNAGDGYFSLKDDVTVLKRPFEVMPKKERTTSTNLTFKLKTTWDDMAGEYTGEIIFTYVPEM